MLEMHKRGARKHEPYLETDNKRPGPPMGESEAEAREIQERKKITWSKEKFNLTSARLDLSLVEWRKVLSVHCAKSSSTGVFFASQLHGAFVVKACADPAISYFCSRLY